MTNNRKIVATGMVVLLLGLLAGSCRKTQYDYIEGKNPNEREKEFVDNVRNTLVGAESGWVGYMYIPANKRGYTFYMQFKEENRVIMYADFNDTTMFKPKESSFQLRNTGIPSLIFDTYNYIHFPADPDGSINGGANGSGLSSDFEYSIIKVSADSIILKGNLKNCDLTMVKIGNDELAHVKDGKLAVTVNDIVNFFNVKKNNYIQVAGNENKMGISFTHSTRQVAYQILESDGTVKGYSGTYFYDVNGLHFSDDFVYGNIRFVSGFMRNGTLFLVDANGKEYEVFQSPTPLTPLAPVFRYNGTYKTMHIQGEVLPPGVTSGWSQLFADMVTRFHNASGRTILYMDFTLTNATKARVVIRYQSNTGSGFTADAEFDYVIADDVITLSNYVPSISNSNWNTRISEIGEMATYFQNGPFKINWAAGSGQELLGGLYPVNNPSSFFYGVLQ